MIDILINFVTAYRDEQKRLITNPRMIVHNYLSTWFLLDFISAFPFDLFTQAKMTSYIQLLKYIKLPRLYKVSKITGNLYKKDILKLIIY